MFLLVAVGIVNVLGVQSRQKNSRKDWSNIQGLSWMSCWNMRYCIAYQPSYGIEWNWMKDFMCDAERISILYNKKIVDMEWSFIVEDIESKYLLWLKYNEELKTNKQICMELDGRPFGMFFFSCLSRFNILFFFIFDQIFWHFVLSVLLDSIIIFDIWIN